MLLGEDRSDEADDRGAVGENADDVGAAADLLVQPLERVVAPELPPVLFRKCGKGEEVGRCTLEQCCSLGEARVGPRNSIASISARSRLSELSVEASLTLVRSVCLGPRSAKSSLRRAVSEPLIHVCRA
jgi:hypothetical protein